MSTYIVYYDRYMCAYEEEFETLAEALDYARSGQEAGEMFAKRIECDGEVVVEPASLVGISDYEASQR